MYTVQRQVFLAKNLLLVSTPPSVAVRGETAGEQNGGSFRTPASYAAHPHNVKMYRMVQCGFENKLKRHRVAAFAYEVEQPVEQLYILVQLLNVEFF